MIWPIIPPSWLPLHIAGAVERARHYERCAESSARELDPPRFDPLCFYMRELPGGTIRLLLISRAHWAAAVAYLAAWMEESDG